MRLILFTLFYFINIHLFSQNNYFQQEVNYKINVTLDDKAHTVSGKIEIDYTNNSPNGLDSIYFHFWGNAFKNNNSAFARQQLRTKNTRFHFSSDNEKGEYSGLNFLVNGEEAQLIFDKKNPDIAVLRLPKQLNAGETINIQSPFKLKIPASFSRLGHVGTSYQMTQWFPKPAVYDHKGWHPMPYLNMGEFYSEFGNFEVTITLPENYVVGASGELQTESEKAFLKNKVAATEALIKKGKFPDDDEFPASSEKMKTIKYIAENVHDFAWFADKRFHVLKDEATLKSGKKIDAWAMFINEEADLWEKGAAYVARSVEFYSEMVGEYPWPQATAVHSALSAGGGMEYPMITVIGNSGNARALDDVITHEVGHNWFYGILAFNERDHPWMDEGMNSYYEYRYMRKYYGARADLEIPGFLLNHSPEDVYEIGYLYQARRNMDQAPETHSDEFNMLNYGLGAYVKPGTVLSHLEHYLGTEEMDRMMRIFYDTWKFKHPYPEDFRKLFEKESGKNLDWFFDGYINSNKKLDYAISDISAGTNGYSISLINKGEIVAPFPVSGIKDGKTVQTKWYDGFSNTTEIKFPQGDYDKIILDAENVTLEVDRKNNIIKTSGPLKKMEPVKIRVLGAAENSRENSINLWPMIGYNKYDGLMLGLGFHNGLIPAKNWEWQWMPLYGFNSSDLVGLANINYNIFPKSEKIKKIRFGISAKSFNYDEPDSLRLEDGGFTSTHIKFQRLVPSISIELQRSPTSHFYQTIQFRSILGNEERADLVDTTGIYTGNSFYGNTINELSYEIGNKRALNPFSLKLTFEHSSFEDVFSPDETKHYVRANMEWKSAYEYDRGKHFNMRIYAGGFLKNDNRKRGFISPGFYSVTGMGINDYRWDEMYLGRRETSGFFSRQITEREGGLKVPIGEPDSPDGEIREVAVTNSFIFAINLKSDLPQNLPGNLPLRPYFDLVFNDDQMPFNSDLDFGDKIWWQGGIVLDILDGGVSVNFPITSSSNIKDIYKFNGQDNFFERITFMVNLHKWNPWKIVDEIEF
ncbi:MAG: M1 family metallopeptidase [Bacteroidota bacterium]